MTTAKGEMWKLGQLHPGDKVHFRLLDLDQAKEIREAEEANLRHEHQEVVLRSKKILITITRSSRRNGSGNKDRCKT